MTRIKHPELAALGRSRIEWATQHMPVLARIAKELEERKPLKGLRVGLALHVEAKTAVLVRTLSRAGAKITIAGCNPLSTKDECAAALAEEGHEVFAWRGETEEEYWENLRSVLETRPQLIIDDGGDLTSLAHRMGVSGIFGACEETTTGVNRAKQMEREGILRFPIIAVNDTPSKRLFDNRFGTAESTLQAVLTITNLQLSGKRVVVAGYGHVGRGIASRMKAMGAVVYVVEVDPIRALEAAMDGFIVTDMQEASRVGDIFITCTGSVNVIRKEHFSQMKDGVLLVNAGHFDVEIDLRSLRDMAKEHRKGIQDVEEFVLPDGRRLYVLCQGRLVNLAGEHSMGHPCEIMDMSFSLQALSLCYLVEHRDEMKPKVYPVPEEIDKKVATLKLLSLGAKLEAQTEEQIRYRSSWLL